MIKPVCQNCGKKDKVRLVNYQRLWKGFECERCYDVVAVVYETDDDGEKLSYKPYRIAQITSAI